jgi:hypothetical protein
LAPKPGRQSGVSTRRHSQKETLRPDRLLFPPFLLPIIWQPQGRLYVPSPRDPNQQKTFLCANGQRRGDQLVLWGSWVGGLTGSAGASIRNVPDDQTSTSCCAASSLSSEFKSSHAVNMRSHTFLSRSFWNSAVAHRSLFAALDRDPCFRTTRHSGYVGGANRGRILRRDDASYLERCTAIRSLGCSCSISRLLCLSAHMARQGCHKRFVCQPTWLGGDVTNVLTSLLLLK